MKIYVTEHRVKRELAVTNNLTVEALLNILGYTKAVAVWINGDQTLYGDYSTRRLTDQDQVLIVKPLAGG